MSAMPAPTFAATPDAADWMPAPDAAQRLAKHPGHFVRLCRDDLAARGLAVKANDANRPGPDRWFVNRAYDPRLASDAPLQIGFGETPLEGYSKNQRNGALQRRACVERFRHALANWPGPVKSWLPRLLEELGESFPEVKPSRSRLYAWHGAYRAPADIVKLIDTRGGDRKATSDADAWRHFRGLFLHENQPTAAQCWEETKRQAVANGWRWCSLQRCRAQLDERIPPQEQTRYRTPALYRTRLAPYIEQRAESAEAGTLWIGDHKELDMLCRFEGRIVRPWLTTWMDWRTRRVVGWVLSDNPNSTTILAALRHGLLDDRNFGGPDAVWIDNGKDYDAWLFHGQTKKERRERIRPNVEESSAAGIFHLLQIEPHFATPYNPNGKARLERWFRTLERFCRTFDTFTGNAPHTKPERLAEIVKNRFALPKFQEVYDRIAPHIDGYNANAEHSKDDLCDDATGERLSPDTAMARWCQRRRVCKRDTLDLLLMHWHRPVTVGRNGITLTLRGRAIRYGQFEPALAPFKAVKLEDRRPVLVSFDPHDLDAVRVYDERFQFICAASMNQTGGIHGAGKIGQRHIAELTRRQSRYNKASRDISEFSITQTLTTEEQLAVIAAEQHDAAAVADEPPVPMKLVGTPLDDASRGARRTPQSPAPTAPSMPSAMDRLREKMGRSNTARPTRPADPASDIDAIADPFERLRRLHA